jgi:phosphoenolpyruvate carboxykinase (ATP)
MIDLSERAEPDIFRALRYGAVLENVVYDPGTRVVDYTDDSITQNTRGSYPIEFIENAKTPCMGGHPENVIFLTCDAFGVLPPVSRLSRAQAMYHFMSGYTARVAGTEDGVTEPEVTFSPCFGGPFMVWHPAKYASLLAERIERSKAQVWLVNTGWTGGPDGVGSRIKLAYTRAIVDAIHDGVLRTAAAKEDPIFGLTVPIECPGVPKEILWPRSTWRDQAAYDQTARKVASLFAENFKRFAAETTDEVRSAGPRI